MEFFNTKYVVMDVETTGLNVRKDTVIGIGFANENGSKYICLYRWDGNTLVSVTPKEEVIALLEALKTQGIGIIAHNAAYDLRIIKSNFGVDLVPQLYCDTLLLKHTIDENPPFGLKELAVKYKNELGYDRDPTQEKKDLKVSIEEAGGKATKDCYELYKADYNVIERYCLQDCELTWDLYNFLITKLTPELHQFYFQDEVLPLYKFVTIPMMERGIQIDVEAVKRAQQEINCDIEQLEIEVQRELEPYSKDFKTWILNTLYAPKPTGSFAQHLAELYQLQLPKTATGKLSIAKAAVASLPPSQFKTFLQTGTGLDPYVIDAVQKEMHQQEGKYFININSKDHLKKIIFEYLNETPGRYTDKGAWQLDDKFLQGIAHKYKFIPPLLVYNKLSKLRSTYMDRFLEQQEDGIFYPEFNQHRTVSGRYGSDIQQLPRAKDEGDRLVIRYTNMIRSFFVSRPGYSFVDNDYESLEPHIFSHVSGDKGLQDIFNKNTDFYSTIAIMTEKLQGVSADKKADNYLGKVSKSARQKAKAYSLGIPYGLGDFKLSKELNILQEEAAKLIKQYLEAFPQLKQWMDQTDHQVKTKGYVTTEVGRVRRMPKAVEIYKKYGDAIFDSLQLWKDYHSDPMIYEEVKALRREIKNYIGNGRNFQIQSLAASVVNRAGLLMAKEFKVQNLDAYLVLSCHDEWLIECNDSITKQVADIVQFCMENVMEFSVKLKAIPNIGKTYGDVK